MERAAIILAGGLAERFQVKGEKWTDKALASLFGKPLLIHVIERVEPVVEEIIICVNSGARRRRYYKVLQNFSIKNVEIHTDVRYAHIRGPAVAITTGLRAAKAERCMILPCDTPFIQPTVIDYLFNACKKSSMVVPIHSNGRLETLMFACKRLPTARIAETLCLLKRDRPDDIIRGSSQVNFVSTIGELKELDPEFKSFVNINFRKDLTFLPTRAFDDGPIRKSINIKLGSPTSDELNMLKQATKGYNKKIQEAFNIFSCLSKSFEIKKLNFWSGLSREKEGNILFALSRRQDKAEIKRDYYAKGEAAFIKAAQNYILEAEIYNKNHIDFLAKRAVDDGLWCQTQTRASLLLNSDKNRF